MGTRPHRLEMIGVLLALAGCLFMIIDPKAARVTSVQPTVVPVMLDAGSAVFGAVFFILSAKNVKRVPICLLLVLMFSHTWIINSGIAKAIDPNV